MANLNKAPGSSPSGDTNLAFNAKIIYILYLVSIAVGLTSIIGVIMAYIYRDQAPVWLRSHFAFQIRTFWIGLLYVIVSSLFTLLLIGFLMLVAALVWMVVRCVKGMQCLDRGEPVPDPNTWWI